MSAMNHLRNDLATLLLRLVIGLLFLIAGINKLLDVDAFSTYIHGQFDETILGGPMLSLFIMLLPLAETALGAMLVMGIFTDVACVGTGFTLLILFLGKLVIRDYATCSQIALYAFLLVVLLRSLDDNRISIDGLRGG